MGRRQRGVFLLILLCALGFAIPSPAQTPPQPPVPTAQVPGMPRRDAATPQQQQDSNTAGIKGRVVAMDNGTPLRRVMLRLSGGKLRNGRTTMTDAQGQYEFKDLGAGRYNLSASKGGYVTLQYGQRGPRESGRAIELVEHQTIEKIDMALPRGAVITGRVVDETGEPLADVGVTAMQYRIIQGKRRLIPMNVGRSAGTNDIGQYRLFGLPPGEYYISASNRVGPMMSFSDESSDTGSGYAPTFFPSAQNAAEAQRVTVGVGDEAVADIQLIPTRVSRLSGNVTMSSGKTPSGGMVTLQTRGETLGMFMNGGASPIRPDGTFSIGSVASGSYLLVVMANSGDSPMSQEGFETAMMPITVAGQDIGEIRVSTTNGISISGHVTFEGGTPDATASKQVRPNCMPVDPTGLAFGGQANAPNEQGEFLIKNVTAPCYVGWFGAPTGWMMKSVLLNGVDVTERPIEPAGKNLTGLEVTFTNRITTISGSVQNAQSQTAKEYTVVVFPEDAQRWQAPLAMRYVRRARPDQTGAFKLTGLPPARYLLAAFENIEEGVEMDPEFLTRIRSLATSAELLEGGMQNVSLKISASTPAQQ